MQGPAGQCRVLQGSAETCRAVQAPAGQCRVLQGSALPWYLKYTVYMERSVLVQFIIIDYDQLNQEGPKWDSVVKYKYEAVSG